MNKKIFDEIIARVIIFMTSQNKLLLQKIHVGGGKTTNTLKTLEEEGYQWIYLAPFHTVIEENLKLSNFYNYNYLHLKSRAKLCLVPDYKRLAAGIPERRIPSIDIRPICENSCPLKDTTCPYYEVKRQLWADPISWAGVHHHLKEFLREFFDIFIDKTQLKYYYDVLIIDENPINVLFENEVANSESLNKLRRVISDLNMTHPDLDKVNRLLDYFILKFAGTELLDYEELLDYFQDIEFNSFYDQYQELLIEEICQDRIEANQIPKEYLAMFKMMAEKINMETIQYMIVKKLASPYNAKKYHFMVFDNSSLLNCPIKIIGLDGTANVNIWESITNRKATVLDRKYIYKNIIQLQVKGNPSKNNSFYARYPLSSWIRNRKISTTGIKLCTLIDKICATKNHTVLIACTKALQPHIQQNINARNVMFCNYYYIRSRNDFYEKCDTIILACEPNVQEFQVDCFSELSGWDKEIWRQIFTQEEMVQTVGRIREQLDVTEKGRKRDKREAYIFPYTPPTNNINDKNPLYPECTIVDYYDLLYGRHRIKNGILDIIKADGFVHRSTVQTKFNISRAYAKELLDQLEIQGDIVDEGRKGYFPLT